MENYELLKEAKKEANIERMKRNRETARKLARLISESGASYWDVDEILRLSKNFLCVAFADSIGGADFL